MKNAGQVSNEAAVASATALKIAFRGHQVALRQPVAFDDVLAALLTRRAINGRNSVPAMVNLLDADCAVSPVRAAVQAEDPRSGLTR